MKYSEKEQEMFKLLGFSKELESNLITPMQLYNFAAIRCFISGITGLASTSLRDCIQYLDNGGARLTPEFDSLIQL